MDDSELDDVGDEDDDIIDAIEGPDDEDLEDEVICGDADDDDYIIDVIEGPDDEDLEDDDL